MSTAIERGTERRTSGMSTARPARATPWHLRVVAVLALLWNGSGAYTIMLAQAGRLPTLSTDEAARGLAPRADCRRRS